jgi:Ca2+/Na+ antiporter
MSEAMQRQTGQTPAWLLFSGVAIGVVGASVKKHAESIGELVVAALATRTYSSDVAVAAALGQGGLALLVAGAVVGLAGLVVIALADQHRRRRCAMDPQHSSAACHDLTSAPSLPSEPSRRVGGAKAA